MPRRHRRTSDSRVERPSSPGTLGEARDTWQNVPYSVRTVTGSATDRPYRCPGCDQVLSGGTHVVVWPVHDIDAVDRRHWHTTCWAARDRRAPGVQRSRAAPRY